MMKKVPVPVIDRVLMLAGYEVGGFEPSATSILYQLRTIGGDEVWLDMHLMLKSLLLFEKFGGIPPLPDNWLRQVAGIHGKAFQEDA